MGMNRHYVYQCIHLVVRMIRERIVKDLGN
ncbi:hypothetical protein B0G69_3750 [Paraburkholderia sp. RAU2J]|nr:hypothetical protein B0G69_3750 [Paraburkholderia sp. RAU2J]